MDATKATSGRPLETKACTCCGAQQHHRTYFTDSAMLLVDLRKLFDEAKRIGKRTLADDLRLALSRNGYSGAADINKQELNQ